jgi:hypothetical protein
MSDTPKTPPVDPDPPLDLPIGKDSVVPTPEEEAESIEEEGEPFGGNFA